MGVYQGMSWSTRKSAILSAAILLATSACASADPGGTRRTTKTSLVPTTTSTTVTTRSILAETAPVTTQAGSSLPQVELLQPSEVRMIAAEFVTQLAAADVADDYASVSEMWSGYPEDPSGRADKLRTLVHANPWVLDQSARFEVVPAWSFDPDSAMNIVAVTGENLEGTFALLLDQEGLIQRIQIEQSNEGLRLKSINDQVSVPGQPTEGGVIAYLWDQELDSITVDVGGGSTTIGLPELQTQQPVVHLLIVSMATPEFPGAMTFLVEQD